MAEPLPAGFELVEPQPLPPGFELTDEEPIAPGVADVSARISAASLAADRQRMTHPAAPEPTAAWRDVLATIPGEIKATAASLIAGAKLREFEEMQEVGLGDPEAVAENIAGEQAVLREVAAEREALAVPDTTTLQRGVKAGLVSLPVAAPALAAGIATRNPALAAASMYPATSALAYGELREEGVPQDLARRHAAFQGVVESGTELIPFAQLLKRLPAGQLLLRTLAAELPGESLAQLAQGASDYVARAQAGGEELTPELALEGLAEAAQGLPETWVATLVATTLQTGAVAGVNRLAAAERARAPRQVERIEPQIPEGFELIDETPAPPIQEPAPPPAATPPEVVSEAPQAPTELPEGFEFVDPDPTIPLPPLAEGEFEPGTPRDLGPPLSETQLARLRARLTTDERLRGAFSDLRRQVGWDTVGGKRVSFEYDEARPGRTKWLPRADWWPGRPGAYNAPDAVRIIDKALRGERLGPQQQEFVDYLAEIAAMQVRLSENLPDQEVLTSAELESTADNAFEMALVARAAEIDEVAVERFAVQYADDDAGFLRAVKGLVDAHEDAEVAQGREADLGEEAVQAARVPDLFGQDVGQQEALNRRNRILERRRGVGREPVPAETASPDDLFRAASEREQAEAAASQIDLEDEGVQAMRAPGGLPRPQSMRASIQRAAGRGLPRPQAARVQAQVGAAYVPLIQAAGAPTAAANTFTLGLRGQPSRTVVIPAKPIRRESAMRAIERAFGVKIYQGKPFRMRKALGFFRPSTFEVRTKAHHDLEVTAHEFFHWLDRTFPAIRKLYHERQYRDELKSVSYDQKLLFEGFAEFGRLFLTQESQAAARAPQFYDAFVQEAQRAGILDRLHKAQAVMHAWYLQGSEARALSKIGPAKRSFEEWWQDNTDGLVDREIQTAFDWLHSIKVVERTVTGGIQDATLSPYGAARLAAGARGTIKAVLNHGTIGIDAQGDIVFTGPGLRQVMEPVVGEFDAAMAYFVGKRADELYGQGREKHLARDEIDALLAIAKRSPKYAEIQKAFADYQAFLERMGEFYIQTGLVSRKQWAMMREANKSYVPFNRILESLEKPDGGKPSGRFMRLKGGTENLRDTWENIVGSINVLVASGLRNHAKTQLYRTIESGPKGQKFAVRLKSEERATLVQPLRLLRQIADKFQAAGPQQHFALQSLVNEIGSDPGLAEAVMYWSGKYQPSAPDVDMVLVNGEPRYYQIGDPLLMQTMQLWNSPRPVYMALRILGGFSGTLRRGITAAPDFLIPNLLRDTFNAATLSRGGQIPLAGSLRGMVKTVLHDDHYWDFMANGGGFASFMHADAGALKKRMERYYVDRKINLRTVIDSPQKLLDVWDDFASAFEYGTRLAEFRARRAQGATRRQATLEARDISVDFAMRGSSELLRWVTTGVPFMNAGIEGLYRVEREVMEKGGRQAFSARRTTAFAMKALLYLTLPSILLWLKFKDDERYKALPDWIKLTHWVWIGEKNVYLIPKPFEVGAAFATVPVQTLEFIEKRDGKEYAEAIAFLVAQAFRLDPTPAAVKAPLDIARNKDFTGRPILPEALKDVAPEEQFTPYTSETAVRLGQQFGISPIKLDYLVRGYIGTLGLYSLSVSDMLVDPTIGTGPKPETKFGENYVIRRFVRESPLRGTQQEQDFYELLEETRQLVATFNKIKQDTRFEQAEAYLDKQERRILFSMRGSIETVAKQAAQINADMRRIRLAADLTASEKRDQLDALQVEKNRLFDGIALDFRRDLEAQRTGTD